MQFRANKPNSKLGQENKTDFTRKIICRTGGFIRGYRQKLSNKKIHRIELSSIEE